MRLQVIHSESVQIVGDLENGEWKKSPTERPVSKQSNFCRAIFLQQGYETCIRCARKNSSRYKLHSENEITTTLIGLIAEIFSNFDKKFTELEQKLLSSVVGTEIYMSTCFFLRKVYFWGKYLISKISWIITKKTQFYAFRGSFREILFPSHLMAKSRPDSDLRLVKKLPFDSKVCRKTHLFFWSRNTMEKFVQRKWK